MFDLTKVVIAELGIPSEQVEIAEGGDDADVLVLKDMFYLSIYSDGVWLNEEMPFGGDVLIAEWRKESVAEAIAAAKQYLDT